jgi:hypothetical protein
MQRGWGGGLVVTVGVCLYKSAVALMLERGWRASKHGWGVCGTQQHSGPTSSCVHVSAVAVSNSVALHKDVHNRFTRLPLLPVSTVAISNSVSHCTRICAIDLHDYQHLFFHSSTQGRPDNVLGCVWYSSTHGRPEYVPGQAVSKHSPASFPKQTLSLASSNSPSSMQCGVLKFVPDPCVESSNPRDQQSAQLPRVRAGARPWTTVDDCRM